MTSRLLAGIRRPACAAALIAGLLCAAPARAQSDDGGGRAPGSATMVPCSEVNNRAMEATLVVRQHASQLSLGFEPGERSQVAVMLAWLDQWAGRLRGFLEFGEFSGCIDESDAETYRRALAAATRVANQAREELLRPVRTAQPQQTQPQRYRRP